MNKLSKHNLPLDERFLWILDRRQLVGVELDLIRADLHVHGAMDQIDLVAHLPVQVFLLAQGRQGHKGSSWASRVKLRS